MREITEQDAILQSAELLADAEGGETIIITRDGRAIVKITPFPDELRHDAEARAAFANAGKLDGQ